MTRYRYQLNGTAALGQTWQTVGEVIAEDFGDIPGDISDVFGQAMLKSFMQLTRGKAVFGSPGVGCQGPYRVTRVLVEEIT